MTAILWTLFAVVAVFCLLLALGACRVSGDCARWEEANRPRFPEAAE